MGRSEREVAFRDREEAAKEVCTPHNAHECVCRDAATRGSTEGTEIGSSTKRAEMLQCVMPGLLLLLLPLPSSPRRTGRYTHDSRTRLQTERNTARVTLCDMSCSSQSLYRACSRLKARGCLIHAKRHQRGTQQKAGKGMAARARGMEAYAMKGNGRGRGTRVRRGTPAMRRVALRRQRAAGSSATASRQAFSVHRR